MYDMKIIYNSNIDSKCASAIVYRTMTNVFMMPNKNDFYEYTEGGSFDIDNDSIISGEYIYIIGVALDDSLFIDISCFIKNGCKVVHIDNHKATIDYLTNLSDENKEMMNKVKQFYRTDESVSAITWAVSCMNEDERVLGIDTPYDFSEGHTHCLVGDDDNAREYVIPSAIRYIYDACMNVHELKESEYFMYALMNMDDHPTNKAWADIIDGSTIYVMRMIDNGVLFKDFQNHINARILATKGFVLKTPNLFDVECLCVNDSHDGPGVFGDSLNKYPMCCRFFYDGKMDRWTYVLYSSDKSENKIDILSKAKLFNGGEYDGEVRFFSSSNVLEK